MGWRRKKRKQQFKWKQYAVAGSLSALFIIGLSIYLLPYIAYYHVEAAVASRDAGRLASHVDLQELRKNIRSQKGQRVIKGLKPDGARIPSQGQSLVDLAIHWAALPSAEGIDQAISTKGFYVSLSGVQGDRRPDPAAGSFDLFKKVVSEPSFSYQSPSEFIVQVKDEKGRYVEYFSFVFSREGLNWRLTNVIPPLF